MFQAETSIVFVFVHAGNDVLQGTKSFPPQNLSLLCSAHSVSMAKYSLSFKLNLPPRIELTMNLGLSFKLKLKADEILTLYLEKRFQNQIINFLFSIQMCTMNPTIYTVEIYMFHFTGNKTSLH